MYDMTPSVKLKCICVVMIFTCFRLIPAQIENTFRYIQIDWRYIWLLFVAGIPTTKWSVSLAAYRGDKNMILEVNTSEMLLK